MQAIEINKHVLFSYAIFDVDSGEVLEQVEAPLAYIYGGKQPMLDKVKAAMAGANEGDIVEVSLTPAEGFGEPDPALIFSEQLSNVPPEYQHIGAKVQLENEAGEIKRFLVTQMNDRELVIDGNHPLAGRNLNFRFTVHAIRDASAEEVAQGAPTDGDTKGLT